MSHKFPILLSFYGMANETETLVFGQLTYTTIKDFSFQEYSRRKTFRTLFRLYRTRPYSNQKIILVFDNGEITCSTNSFGAFYHKHNSNFSGGHLQLVKLAGGEEVKTIEGLYPFEVFQLTSQTIVVSDIDDTLLHSFIFRKLRKFRTLMFTTMEKRRAVTHMHDLILSLTKKGASPVYLSNSEQNLYPMIYRFLTHNKFPSGPLFLKQLRSLWDVLWNIKFPLKNIHKTTVLEELIKMYPAKKFVLMGDNTQEDLKIYLTLAGKYTSNISHIVIRKVIDRKEDEPLISEFQEKNKENGIGLYYADEFPEKFNV